MEEVLQTKIWDEKDRPDKHGELLLLPPSHRPSSLSIDRSPSIPSSSSYSSSSSSGPSSPSSSLEEEGKGLVPPSSSTVFDFTLPTPRSASSLSKSGPVREGGREERSAGGVLAHKLPSTQIVPYLTTAATATAAAAASSLFPPPPLPVVPVQTCVEEWREEAAEANPSPSLQVGWLREGEGGRDRGRGRTLHDCSFG